VWLVGIASLLMMALPLIQGVTQPGTVFLYPAMTVDLIPSLPS
jgi:hypothetical protein